MISRSYLIQFNFKLNIISIILIYKCNTTHFINYKVHTCTKDNIIYLILFFEFLYFFTTPKPKLNIKGNIIMFLINNINL